MKKPEMLESRMLLTGCITTCVYDFDEPQSIAALGCLATNLVVINCYLMQSEELKKSTEAINSWMDPCCPSDPMSVIPETAPGEPLEEYTAAENELSRLQQEYTQLEATHGYRRYLLLTWT
ncbi:MAG TPA: hypothetical protein PLV25_06075 [Opitutales bacterium]|nr:hypothetical protein [Opitutales bacterium]